MSAVFKLRSDFLSLTDSSNWPEMNGDFYLGYADAMETVGEAILDWWDEPGMERTETCLEEIERLKSAEAELVEALRKALLWTDAENDVGEWRSDAEALIAKYGEK